MYKRIALFVIGHSPAIITETLAAHYVSENVVPNKITVITTQTGAAKLKKRLFAEQGWQEFCQQWPAMAKINFSSDDIFFPENVDDIQTEDENRAMTSLILETVHEMVETSDILDASLAGGRKTMGYYLGFAMSFFAREGDSLSHVLVPSVLEKNSQFLVPTAEEAESISLIDVPFIRLKKHIKPSIAKLDAAMLVASAQTAIDKATLEPVVINVKTRTIHYLGQEMTLPEREFTFYIFFAKQKLDSCVEKNRPLCGDCSSCFLSIDDMDNKSEELLNIRASFGGEYSGHYENFEKVWREPRAAQDNLAEPLRRISKNIESSFGIDPRAECLHIKNVGKRGAATYGLLADVTQIHIVS